MSSLRLLLRPSGLSAVFGLLLLASSPLWSQSESKQKIKGLKEYAKEGSAAIPKITPYLKDIDEDVRREAVRSLVQVGTQRSLEPLIAACKDNDAEVQIRATDGLVNFYLPGYVETGLSASLKHAGTVVTGRWSDIANSDIIEPDTPLRPEIVDALSALVRGGASMDARANAARALGILRARTGQPALLDSLKSKDSRLIFESLIALQKIRDRSSGDRAAFLIRDLDENVQLAAIETCGILGSKEAVPQLKRVLEDPRSKKARRYSVTALANIADPSTRSILLGYLNDKDDEVRASAIEGLGRIADPQDRAALNSAWQGDQKTPVRLATAFALVRAGNIDAGDFTPLGYLVNQLNQRSWRGVAGPYLGELALHSAPRGAIIAATQRAATPDEKIGLIRALAGCGSADAVPVMEQMSKDPDAAVAKEALRTLRILRGSVR
ncbi:MAG: HEAT repeat domain-containing protein [Acidobacteria bacterium]|nr:HEAT repeat domain-containing protein [Acidobacteriota bacterium]